LRFIFTVPESVLMAILFCPIDNCKKRQVMRQQIVFFSIVIFF